MKLTALARYPRLGASSRLRLFQFLPALQAQGMQAQILPFFDEAYLQRLYRQRSTVGPSLRAYGRQFRTLHSLGGQDLLWIEKEALPWMPWTVERLSLPRHVPVLTDYDDAVFHCYDLHRNGLVRHVLGHKIDRVMAHSALVMAGNAYLAARARAAGAQRVEIVPTVVDIAQYRVRPDRACTGKGTSAPRIGWIGTPSTWQEFLRPMMPMLRDLAREGGARILVIGACEKDAMDPLSDHQPWSEDTEVARIQEIDIGIMPLTDTPWAQGKCGYKLIQYMACGIPVVASPVGVNQEIVEQGVNGFLARSDDEWHAAISTLLADPDLRRRMGAAGRKKVEEKYSLQVWGPRVAQMMRDLITKRQIP